MNLSEQIMQAGPIVCYVEEEVMLPQEILLA